MPVGAPAFLHFYKMSARVKKILLLLLAAALLAGSGRIQTSLNQDRARLHLTRTAAPLADAPPMLAFTAVALGGFRGLISNYLWIHANDLQQNDKYFEAAQLADWITDLEPHFSQVWIFEAWNMAFNISVEFKDFSDRWHWVQQGIELLRDKGLAYNPNELSLYQQLAWFFQFKLGDNLDDANMYYKRQWAEEMTPFFGPQGTNFSELLKPSTAAARARVQLFRQKYKMDPVFAQKVDEKWGPLDWRLPEAHAIYWAALGLEEAKKDPEKAKEFDLEALRRVIYQSLLQAFYHGRLVINPFTKTYELYPNLAVIPKVNDAYAETLKAAGPDYHDNVARAWRYFLENAVYFLYEDNRLNEAAKWYRYLGRKYPDDPLLSNVPNSRASQLTLDQYVIARVQEDIGSNVSRDRITAAVEGLLTHAYDALAIGEDDQYAGYKLLAAKVYENYQNKIADWKEGLERKGLPPFAEMNRTVLDQLLDPQQGLPFAARAVLRTQLSLPAETNATSAATVTNTPPAEAASTNAAPATGK